jgi:hypothetical protein
MLEGTRRSTLEPPLASDCSKNNAATWEDRHRVSLLSDLGDPDQGLPHGSTTLADIYYKNGFHKKISDNGHQLHPIWGAPNLGLLQSNPSEATKTTKTIPSER